MRIWLFACGLTGASFIVHLLVWWAAIPRRQTRALLLLFATTPIALLAIGLFARSHLPAWYPATSWEWLHVAVFHIAFALAYVVVYSALEERSPSMTLLSRVAQAPAGCSRTQLETLLGKTSPVEVRLDAMVRDGMISSDQSTYRITAKGRRWAATFEAMRKLLGFTPGG